MEDIDMAEDAAAAELICLLDAAIFWEVEVEEDW